MYQYLFVMGESFFGLLFQHQTLNLKPLCGFVGMFFPAKSLPAQSALVPDFTSARPAKLNSPTGTKWTTDRKGSKAVYFFHSQIIFEVLAEGNNPKHYFYQHEKLLKPDFWYVKNNQSLFRRLCVFIPIREYQP